MKEYVLEYILGYLKDKLNYDYLDINYIETFNSINNKLLIKFKWKEINVNVEFGEDYINNNDVLQISRRAEREICNKILCLIHKEEW